MTITKEPKQKAESLWAEINADLSTDRYIGGENPRYDKEGSLVIEVPKDIYEYAEGMATYIADRYDISARFVLKTGHTSEEWQIFTAADALQDRPPTQYLVSNLIAKSSLNMIYGRPGVYKTLLGMDMHVSVAADLPWLAPLPNDNDTKPYGTSQCSTLWIDFDNGADRTHERFGALLKARNLSGDTPAFYVTMPYRLLDGTDPESVDYLIYRAKELEAGLITIDNLLAVSGNADENSADMGRVMGQFRRVAEETGAGVNLLHHPRKAGDISRGHTSIRGTLDLELRVEREERDAICTITSTKSRSASVYPFAAHFTYEWKPETTDLDTARFFGCRPKDDGKMLKIADAKHHIESIVKNFPGIAKQELIQKSKSVLIDIGINKIRDYIDEMAEDDGTLVETSGTGTKKEYHLP